LAWFKALGRYDFKVPYMVWGSYKDLLPNISVFLFKNSAHWAHMEEPNLFDRRLVEWLKGH
jgi:pimeloyl-ACP methyl ester carboxylesterase